MKQNIKNEIEKNPNLKKLPPQPNQTSSTSTRNIAKKRMKRFSQSHSESRTLAITKSFTYHLNSTDVRVNNFFNNILKFKIIRVSMTKSKNNNKTS